MKHIRSRGIVAVDVTFSGSGDEGQIETMELFDSAGKVSDREVWDKLMDETIDWVEQRSILDKGTGQWVSRGESRTKSLWDILEQVTCDTLEANEIYWTNGAGGYGLLCIRFEEDPPSITIDFTEEPEDEEDEENEGDEEDEHDEGEE